ncbi:hypothetical protein I7I51_07605 [Histoplasma capsulatum]|uniref:Uncharacterized protein n=1 Tax=Ajellomyces capsulatus TaxID=5037 RepID=A0A8A1M174_AJECA|nr:hypothetical protein I7I51_07605 [Histoplasma capsulatum]
MTDDFSAHDLSAIWTNVKPQMEPVSKNAQEPIHLIHQAGTMNGPSPGIADASHSFFIGWGHLKIPAYEHRDILNLNKLDLKAVFRHQAYPLKINHPSLTRFHSHLSRNSRHLSRYKDAQSHTLLNFLSYE